MLLLMMMMTTIHDDDKDSSSSNDDDDDDDNDDDAGKRDSARQLLPTEEVRSNYDVRIVRVLQYTVHVHHTEHHGDAGPQSP